jgi:hypothetical protein
MPTDSPGSSDTLSGASSSPEVNRMASTLGELHLLCTCGRPLRVPTDVRFVQASNGDIEARVELDRGYLYAHMHTWHQPNDGHPMPAHDLLAAA